MSKQGQRVPQTQKEDLLKVPFKIVEGKPRNVRDFSLSLSLSNSTSSQSRFSFGFGRKKSDIRAEDIKNTSYHTHSDEIMGEQQEKSMDSSILFDQIPNFPGFERRIDTSIQRVRKSSFFGSGCFSSSEISSQSYSNELSPNYYNSYSVQLDQIQENTQGAKTPHFKLNNKYENIVDDLNDEDLIITQSQRCQSKSKVKQSPQKSRSNQPQILFREQLSQSKNSIQLFQKEEKKPLNEVEFRGRHEEQKKSQLIGKKKQELKVQRSQKKEAICFICGKNHYSNLCKEDPNQFKKDWKQKSNDIKCFNCKKNGHTTKNCFQPRKCHYCESLDHISRECPTVENRKRRQICINCNELGHFARECTKPSKCYLCHQIGHQIRNCPKKKQNDLNLQVQHILRPQLCFNCKKPGHYAPECPEPSRCHRCGQQGHFSRDCPHSVFFRRKSVDGSMNQEKKKEIKISQQKPASEPEGRKNKPFLENLKWSSKKKKNN